MTPMLKKYLVRISSNIVYLEAETVEDAWIKAMHGNGQIYNRIKITGITKLNDNFDIERKSMNVVGVSGQKQMGKDTVSDYLALKLKELTNKTWNRVSLATPVKRIFCESFNKTSEFIEKWKTNPEPPPGLLKPVREGLTFIGDGFRSIDPNIWINKLYESLDKNNGSIISDCRYFNELKSVKDRGGFTILVVKADRLNFDDNRSESEIRPLIEWVIDNSKEKPEEFDLIDCVILNDGSIEDLYKKIDNELVPFMLNYFNLGK